MSKVQEWHSSITFSERTVMVQAIISALKSSLVDSAPDRDDSLSKAMSIEKEIYASSSSKAAYEDACTAIINSHKNNDPAQPLQDLDEGEAVDESTPTQPAATIGTYAHAARYRDGLFSTIYKASIILTPAQPDAEVVALKVTTPNAMVAPHDSKREARILALVQHPKIITLIDAFHESGGRFVLVFPFMPYDLERHLKTTHPRHNHTQARSHLRDLFEALAFLHAAGIIHRDIKPSNILLKSPNGPAYLADFGIAWVSSDVTSEKTDEKITDVGTTSYRPPELLFGNTSYGCTLDLWAAGCVVAQATCLGDVPLFDSGDLGSELALIRSIFESLGTPDLDVWPEAVTFRDWGKMQFREYPTKPWSELLPGATAEARDLVAGLVRYESASRLTAAEALDHPYFNGLTATVTQTSR